DDEDEEEQRRDVREPAPDRLRRQALLGDLGLRDLVEGLADRLPAIRQERELRAHQDDSENDRKGRSDQEGGHRLGDRKVEPADVDRNPVVLLELGRRIEVAAGEGGRRKPYGAEAQSDRSDPKTCPPAPHALGSWE